MKSVIEWNKEPDNGKSYIYTLQNPVTGEIRYIGRTKRCLRARLNSHISASKYCKDHKANWIKYLIKNNLRPEIYLLDIVEEELEDYWEKFYISLFKTWNFNLNNSTLGTESYGRHSAETRLKISISNTGKKRTEQQKAQIKATRNLETFKSEEYREKISEIHKQRYIDNPELRLKRAILKGSKEFNVYRIEKDKSRTFLKSFIIKEECQKEFNLSRQAIRKALNRDGVARRKWLYFEYVNPVE